MAWLDGLYGLLWCLAAAGAVGALRIRCEGFGCMGLGVAWMAWAGLYFATLLLGAIAQARATGRRRAVLRWALAAQWLGAAGLLAYWLLVR